MHPHHLRSATFRCQIRLCHAHAAAVAWSSSRSFSVRLGRARHQRRIPHRDRRVVTRHDEPQPAVEARRLRPVGRHVPASITRSTTAMSPAKSPCLPPSQHLHDAPTQLNYHQLSQVNPIPQSPHHSYSRSKSSNPHNLAPAPRGFVLGRFPYAGPSSHGPPAMAGIRKPSPSRSSAHRGWFADNGRRTVAHGLGHPDWRASRTRQQLLQSAAVSPPYGK